MRCGEPPQHVVGRGSAAADHAGGEATRDGSARGRTRAPPPRWPAPTVPGCGDDVWPTRAPTPDDEDDVDQHHEGDEPAEDDAAREHLSVRAPAQLTQQRHASSVLARSGAEGGRFPNPWGGAGHTITRREPIGQRPPACAQPPGSATPEHGLLESRRPARTRPTSGEPHHDHHHRQPDRHHPRLRPDRNRGQGRGPQQALRQRRRRGRGARQRRRRLWTRAASRRSWARPAPASRRCCTCSPVSTGRPPARCTSATPRSPR